MKIINNIITNNSSLFGGGISICCAFNQSNIVIEQNIISNNIAFTARDAGGLGGGIFINETSGRISNNYILKLEVALENKVGVYTYIIVHHL